MDAQEKRFATPLPLPAGAGKIIAEAIIPHTAGLLHGFLPCWLS